jgi:hypothetical protein
VYYIGVDEQTALYVAWCAARGCGHAHCPDGCEKPMPILLDDGRMVCGRCLVRFGEVVEVVPCVPGVCGVGD